MEGIAMGETREFLYKDLTIDPDHPGLNRVKRRMKPPVKPVKTEHTPGSDDDPIDRTLPAKKKKNQ